MPSFHENSPYSNPFNRALARILQDRRFTAQEMAEVCDCSDRHIQKVAAGQAHLNDEKTTELQRWLCDNHELRACQVSITPEYFIGRRIHGHANGSGKDEMTKLVKAAASVDDYIKNRDEEGLKRIIEMIRTALRDTEAELDSLKQE